MNNKKQQEIIKRVLSINVLVLFSQFTIASLSGSLSVTGDAFHALSDVIALAIALSTTIMLSKQPDEKLTFGLYKAEFLMTMVNCIIIFSSAIFIIYQAIEKILYGKHEPSGKWMIIASLIGILANAISAFLMKAQSEKSMIMKSAYVEVLADFASSATLLLAGVLVLFYKILWADILFAIIISLWIVFRSYKLLKETLSFVLDAVPHHINLDEVKQEILKVAGIQSLHQLHIWAVHDGQTSLSVHLVILKDYKHQQTRQEVEKLLQEKFSILYTTIQTEKD